MRIVHLSTFETGGAGIAAKRLHDGLLASGQNSVFLSLSRGINRDSLATYYSTLPSLKRIWFRLKDNLSVRKKTEFKFRDYLKSLVHDAEIYTIPYSRFHTEYHPVIKSADILNIHWVGGLVNYPTFFSEINKPVVWTFHDMNPFMGGFHYENDKVDNYGHLKDLEDQFISVKEKAIRSLKSRLIIVSPSLWLAQKAAKSSLLRENEIVVIPNGIEIMPFSQKDKIDLKGEFGFPRNKKTLLFLADNIMTKRKGFDLLVAAMNELNDQDFFLATIGQAENVPITRDDIKHFGRIKDQVQIKRIIAAADAVVIPSREDNLPNVMLEAFSCGTPVIAFPVGGLGEHIKNGFNGLLAKEITDISLNDRIRQFIAGNWNMDSNSIRNYANENFAIDKVVLKYMSLYNNILSNQKISKEHAALLNC